jgi:F-type H+-transporting ATPase subunit gamma
MSGPEEIEERLANVREIGEIVAAMHAMAIGHQQEARGHLDAIRGHAAGIATALSSTLALHRGGFAPEAVDGVSVAIIVGAAQGFSGAYAQRMAEAAKAVAAADTALFVVGGSQATALSILQTH